MALVKCELRVVQSTSELLNKLNNVPTINYLSDWHNTGQAPLVLLFLRTLRPLIKCHSVLVLGLCFFAGGIRFYEQGFDASVYAVRETSPV